MSSIRMLVFGSIFETLYRAWAYVTHGRTFAVVLGIAFAVLAIGLLIASRTRWGQAKPLTKCIVLSVLAHVWLLMYAYGTHVVLPQGDPRGRENGMAISIDHTLQTSLDEPVEENLENQDADESQVKPWEDSVPIAELPKPELSQPNIAMLMSTAVAATPEPVFKPTPLPSLPQELFFASNLPLSGTPDLSSTQVLPPLPNDADNSDMQFASSGSALAAAPTNLKSSHPGMPKEYQLRQAQNRLQLAMPYGADADSEASVEAGLQWLVKAQAQDGSWNAKRFGGGTETNALGLYRHNTGERADTGVSGLALIAFLSAGHTHIEGEYRQTVADGLSYLLESQMPSGDLSGRNQMGPDAGPLNARMYCHGIATLALGEAYAMTHDEKLKPALINAARFTVNAQDRVGGGWRYKSGDPGDLSQFGWQAMALRSIERSGISVPIEVKRGMQRFLDSCATGQSGGLARYQPGQGAPTETMTAEALACRLMIDYPLSAQAQQEAKSMIMSQLPGIKPDNVYYWYYATLALFQLQDSDWRTWNQAVKKRLLTSQIPAYQSDAGSWNPDQLWGGYGGRVYSTAMSCLCLEVYYRYLPMYQPSNTASTGIRFTR